MIAFEWLQLLPLTFAKKSTSEYDDWILVDPSHRWYKRPQLNYLMSVLLLYITIARRLYSHYLRSAHWARDSRTTESRTMQRLGRGIPWAVSLLMIFASQSKSHLYTENWGYCSSWSVTNWSVARQAPRINLRHARVAATCADRPIEIEMLSYSWPRAVSVPKARTVLTADLLCVRQSALSGYAKGALIQQAFC